MEYAVENRNELFNTKIELSLPPDIKRRGLSLETINVNLLVDTGRLIRMKTLLKQWNNDITIMIDTRIAANKAHLLKRNESLVISTDKPYRGIIIQINKRLDPELIEKDDDNANFLAITFNLDGKKIGLLGIYAPNNDNPKFLKDMINKVVTKLSLMSDELIVAGDFNVNLSAGIGYSSRESYKKKALKDCMKVWDLKDIVEQGGIEQLTYIHTTKNKGLDSDMIPLKEARLDAILTTIDPSKTMVSIGRFYPSDHASVRVTFQEAKESGTKVWKMNVNLFEDERLVKKWKSAAINLTEANELLKVRLDNETDITEKRYDDLIGKDSFKWWNDLIGIVKASAIETSKESYKKDKERNETLLKREEINNLEKDELSDILDEIDRHETDKIKIKTELKNYKMNASNKKLTKHKMRLEGQSRKINKIAIDGRVLTNSDKIKEGIQRYYKYQFRCQCKQKCPKTMSYL